MHSDTRVRNQSGRKLTVNFAGVPKTPTPEMRAEAKAFDLAVRAGCARQRRQRAPQRRIVRCNQRRHTRAQRRVGAPKRASSSDSSDASPGGAQ